MPGRNVHLRQVHHVLKDRQCLLINLHEHRVVDIHAAPRLDVVYCLQTGVVFRETPEALCDGGSLAYHSRRGAAISSVCLEGLFSWLSTASFGLRRKTTTG